MDLIGNTYHYAVMATVRSFELVTTNAVVECDDKSGIRCDSFQRFHLKLKYSDNARRISLLKGYISNSQSLPKYIKQKIL